MFNRINILREKGYYPDSVLDIGAHHGIWTRNMSSIYNRSKYYLFEAIDYEELKRIQHPLIKTYNVILSDEIKGVDWFEKHNTGDSIFREKSKHFVDCVPVKKQTIDLNTFIANNNILSDSKNIFIKIDCQGSEIPILKGSTDIFDRTDFILLEIPFFGVYNEGVPNFLEHIKYMESIGFIPFDILENHYINNFNMQIDMLFINKNHKFNRDVNELLYV